MMKVFVQMIPFKIQVCDRSFLNADSQSPLTERTTRRTSHVNRGEVRELTAATA